MTVDLDAILNEMSKFCVVFLAIFFRMHGKECPEIWHADVSSPLSELIAFLSWSVDFPNCGTILT